MTRNDKIKIGETFCPLKNKIVIRDDKVKGSTWSAYRVGEEYFFEFLAARHGGGTDKYRIKESEFEDLKVQILAYDDLIQKYDCGDFDPE